MARKGCLSSWTAIGLALFFCTLVLVFVPRLFILGHLRKSLSPEQMALLDRLKTEPLDFPGTWSLESFDPPELVAFVEESQTLLLSVPPKIPEKIKSRLSTAEPFVEGEWLEVAKLVEAASAYLRAVKTLVSQPGYRLGVLPLPKKAPNLPDYTAIQSPGHLLLLKARLADHFSNDLRVVFPYALTALQLTTRKNSSPLISHLIAVALQLRLTKSLAYFAAKCEDPQLLRDSLADMNRLAPLTELGVFLDPLRLMVTDAVQLENEAGGNIRLVTGKPGSYYFKKLQSPDSAWRRSVPAKRPNRWNARIERLALPLYSYWGILDIVAGISLPDVTEGLVTEQRASAELTLSRLALANRIHELEGQGRARDTASFVPDLLPEDPIDPFTDEAYLWSASDSVFYSVGPDKVSQENRLRYSPTNGTVSAGDISLP